MPLEEVCIAVVRKSKTIAIHDVALMARIDISHIKKFLNGSEKLSKNGVVRITRILNLINAGMVTKSQYGVYHFHNEPVVAPVREMTLSVLHGLILPGVKIEKPPARMPSFDKLFG